jgi:hypothetical protein
MKRQALSLISLLSLLLVAGSAMAQTIHVRANVPFNFAAGSKTFPAGTYDIGTIGNGDSKMLLLQARDRNSSMMVGSNAAQTHKPRLLAMSPVYNYATYRVLPLAEMVDPQTITGSKV